MLVHQRVWSKLLYNPNGKIMIIKYHISYTIHWILFEYCIMIKHYIQYYAQIHYMVETSSYLYGSYFVWNWQSWRCRLRNQKVIPSTQQTYSNATSMEHLDTCVIPLIYVYSYMYFLYILITVHISILLIVVICVKIYLILWVTILNVHPIFYLPSGYLT